MTLSKFYDAFADKDYLDKMETAFNWFLGNNRLHQIIYNPCTGGCYDGLEETHVNLNQGAESTISYLMARLTVDKYRKADKLAVSKSMAIPENKLVREDAIVFPAMRNQSSLTSYNFSSHTSGSIRKKRRD
jgi:hypothetical protein